MVIYSLCHISSSLSATNINPLHCTSIPEGIASRIVSEAHWALEVELTTSFNADLMHGEGGTAIQQALN